MPNDLRLLILSAMYENGGNTVHRLLDGHPQMLVYPFESQLGTRFVSDHLTSLYPAKYRWPTFHLDATVVEDYRAIIDEECKVRARTPQSSKFREYPFDFSDDERLAAYQRHIARTGRSRADNVAAFFRSTFEAWKDYRHLPEASVYVGYSPIVGVDADKILADFPNAYVVHIVRNPWSAYADTKKRPVPLSMQHYLTGWTVSQYHALLYQQRFPERHQLIRVEDVMTDPCDCLGSLCVRLGLDASPSLERPTWNGKQLAEVYPWGTIRTPTPAANQATALELSERERSEIREYAWQYLDALDYQSFV
jgi:hypothetical protein